MSTSKRVVMSNKQDFLDHLEEPSRGAARLLWNQLDAFDVRCQYQEWYAHAYEDQAITNGHRVWDELSASLYNALEPDLSGIGMSNDDRWSFLVAYIGGGWMMGLSDPRRTTHPIIQEEP